MRWFGLCCGLEGCTGWRCEDGRFRDDDCGCCCDCWWDNVFLVVLELVVGRCGCGCSGVIVDVILVVMMMEVPAVVIEVVVVEVAAVAMVVVVIVVMPKDGIANNIVYSMYC